MLDLIELIHARFGLREHLRVDVGREHLALRAPLSPSASISVIAIEYGSSPVEAAEHQTETGCAGASRIRRGSENDGPRGRTRSGWWSARW